jgi:poly(3-hydroxybutyrate) depolymerase
MKPQSLSELASCLIIASCFASGCSSSTGATDGGSSGGASIAGTSAMPTGGTSAGGSSPAGSGAPGTSGSGTTAGGAGGSFGGQTSSGGTSSGGTSSGGTSSGGTSSGGTSSGGSGGPGGSTGAGKSAGCGKMPSIPSNQYNNGTHIAITAANMQREYILNVPANYDNTHPYKFVIAYHELNGNDDEMYRNKYYHLLPLANDSTIFVAPNGQQKNKNCTSATNCGWPNPNDSDMLPADAVVAQIEESFCIDTNRIFATGWSYGASMSYETACERPLGGMTNGVAGYIRSIAVYSAAQLSGSCKPTKPVAYYASHGTNDQVLDYTLRGLPLLQNMVAVDGCGAMTPTKVTSGNHVCTNFMGCSAGYPVEFCSFNGPHTPDPTDSGQQTSWEYRNVWTFLSQF